MSPGALDDVNVVELGHYIAGPYCGKLLADSGANVVKVERPGTGDGARRIGPFPKDEPNPERSGLFLYLNTSKRGITLDLKSNAGRRILLNLLSKADVLIENFRPGVMERLGLDYAGLSAANPRLIITSISNFGQTGPYRDYKADETVLNAMGGLTYLNGAYDREPLTLGLRQAQFRGGQYATVATMMALYEQRSSGLGQQVDVAIAECISAGLMSRLSEYYYRGAVPRRQPKMGTTVVDAQPVPTMDGYVVPGVTRPPTGGWKEFVDLVGDPELAAPRFVGSAALSANARDFNERLRQAFAKRSSYEIFHAAEARRLPFGVVQNGEGLLNCPQLASREFFAEVDHPDVGKLRFPGAPFKATETQPAIRRRAPHLGEHNEEILVGELGYSKSDLVRLRQEGAI